MVQNACKAREWAYITRQAGTATARTETAAHKILVNGRTPSLLATPSGMCGKQVGATQKWWLKRKTKDAWVQNVFATD